MWYGTAMTMAAILMALLAAGPLAAGAADDKAQTTTQEAKTMVTDSWVTSKTKISLFADERVKGSQVSVDTTKGVVHLRGKVDSAEAKSAAGDIAKGIEGVKSVKKPRERLLRFLKTPVNQHLRAVGKTPSAFAGSGSCPGLRSAHEVGLTHELSGGSIALDSLSSASSGCVGMMTGAWIGDDGHLIIRTPATSRSRRTGTRRNWTFTRPSSV